MKIAQVAPLYEPVPPRLYGGTERVVSYITEELVRRGHEITLFASGDSRTKAELVSVIPSSIRLNHHGPDPYAYHYLQLTEVSAQADVFDIIHCHLEYLGFPFSRFCGTPSLHTLHGRLDLPYWAPMMESFPDVSLVSISNSQRRPLAGVDVHWMDTVYHGLPDYCFKLYPEKGKYLAYYSRMSQEKRPDLAIEAAKRTGIPLKMAGKIGAEDLDYFTREIRPKLDDPLIEYIGEIGDKERTELLGNAMALLFPIEWPEPFGLVMIEAMANGTPVIARPFGAVPEVVEEGVTGLIADGVDGLVEAVGMIDRIDRQRCYLRARERFSVKAMVDRYEKVYLTLTGEGV